MAPTVSLAHDVDVDKLKLFLAEKRFWEHVEDCNRCRLEWQQHHLSILNMCDAGFGLWEAFQAAEAAR